MAAEKDVNFKVLVLFRQHLNGSAVPNADKCTGRDFKASDH